MSQFDFKKLLLLELGDMYNSEQQIIEALPNVIKAVSSSKLKEALRDHLEETKEHLHRLEQVYELLNVRPHSAKCEAMKGILEEGEEIIEKLPKSVLKDAALIGACQKVEHYEIAAYGTIHSHAKCLGAPKKVLSLINDTLHEEGNADSKLTELADGTFFTTGINQEAVDSEELVGSKQSRR